jgi:UrcA family protein
MSALSKQRIARSVPQREERGNDMTYTNSISMVAAVVLTASGVALFAAPISAKAPIVVTGDPDRIERRVSYADLNLAAVAGQRSLNRRVTTAISSLCLEATGGLDRNLSSKFNMNKCGHSAWTQARPQIAQAVQRASEIAENGRSNIPPVAISIAIAQ